jgi:hypothetical protein
MLDSPGLSSSFENNYRKHSRRRRFGRRRRRKHKTKTNAKMGGGAAIDAAGGANASLYKGRTTPAVVMISLVAACGGLL